MIGKLNTREVIAAYKNKLHYETTFHKITFNHNIANMRSGIFLAGKKLKEFCLP